MAKPGNNKKRCEKYKMRGALAENKLKKQKRHEKRIEKFKKRREEGKCYVYQARDKSERPKEPNSNVGSNRGRHTEYARLTSLFSKLDREIAMAMAAEKAQVSKATSRKSTTTSSSDR